MKKLLLLIAVAAFGMTAAYAQTDTTKMIHQKSSHYQYYPTKDMKKVSQKEIPAPLRTTLQEQEYSGWENGTVYFNSFTNEYAWQAPVTTGSSSATTPTKNTTTWYRFDKNGKRIPDPKP